MAEHREIVVIGAGLTGLTLAYYLKKAGKDVVVLEKENRTGGAFRTIEKNGFVFEAGPNSGSLSSVELVELFDDLSQYCQLEIADKNAKQRWIWKNNAWHNLPNGILSGIKTPLFSFADKLRILKEPFVRKGNNPNESVADLVRRRLGKSFLNYAVSPFIRGIYAGNPEQLTTKYALPKLYLLEQKYGSFIGGALKKPKKTEREKRANAEVFSVKGGLQNLTKALCSQIGDNNICVNANNIEIKPKNKGFEVSFEKENIKKEIHANIVITTTGSYTLPKLLPFVDSKQMQTLNNLQYAKVVQVVAIYNKWTAKPLKAFGGLFPEKENRKALGILFPASLFSNRAKNGGAILSVFAGGVNNPELIKKDDNEIKQLIVSEIEKTLGMTEKPNYLYVFRYHNAIPQYQQNTKQRYEAIAEVEKKYEGLYIAGNIKDGIGIPHRVKQGKVLADMIIEKTNK